MQRYNYHYAVFSTSGYTKIAQQYAIAHQVYLIDYSNIGAISPLINTILDLDISDFTSDAINHPQNIKRYFLSQLGLGDEDFPNIILSDNGAQKCRSVLENINNLDGSYFGMLQGRWPIHLILGSPLPESIFKTTDSLRCRIFSDDIHSNKWRFVPSDYNRGHDAWFEVEFTLPEEIANLVFLGRNDPSAIANTKRQYFSFMIVSGMIGGLKRIIKLELDNEWLNQLVTQT